MQQANTEQIQEKDIEHALATAVLAEKIYVAAMDEHPEFAQVPDTDFRDVINVAISEIEMFEEASRRNLSTAPVDLSAVWVFSGPTTYYGEIAHTTYSGRSWISCMDRDRFTYAEKIFPSCIIYNGSDMQNDALKHALEKGDAAVSPENVLIFGNDFHNTLDQIKHFVMLEHLHVPGKEIGFVSHAPHLMRIVHMLQMYQTVPSDMAVRLFPIATPEEGREEYTIMEVKGLLYYIFIGKNADVVAYPYLLK